MGFISLKEQYFVDSALCVTATLCQAFRNMWRHIHNNLSRYTALWPPIQNPNFHITKMVYGVISTRVTTPSVQIDWV